VVGQQVFENIFSYYFINPQDRGYCFSCDLLSSGARESSATSA
jgi:hypothetical protein